MIKWIGKWAVPKGVCRCFRGVKKKNEEQITVKAYKMNERAFKIIIFYFHSYFILSKERNEMRLSCCFVAM